MAQYWKLIVCLLVVCLVSGCSSSPVVMEVSITPSTPPTKTAAPTATFTPTATAVPTATPTITPTATPTTEPVIAVADLLRQTVGEYDLALIKADAQFKADVYNYVDGKLSENPSYSIKYDLQASASRGITGLDPYTQWVKVIDKTLPVKEIDGQQFIPVYLAPWTDEEIEYFPADVLEPVAWDAVTCVAPLRCSPNDARRILATILLAEYRTNSLAYVKVSNYIQGYIVGVSTGRIRYIEGSEDRYAVETILYEGQKNQLFLVWIPAPLMVYDANSPDFRKMADLAYIEEFYAGRLSLVLGNVFFVLNDEKTAVNNCHFPEQEELWVNRCLAIAAMNGESDLEIFAGFHAGEIPPADFILNSSELYNKDQIATHIRQQSIDPTGLLDGITSIQVGE